jgi:hypothetical protein
VSAHRPSTPIYRAPMRARDRDDVPPFAGARHGVEHGLVGIGRVEGDKGARMLHRFAELPDGTFVWTRTGEDVYRLGRIAGPLREDGSAAARAVGIRHVRPAAWLERAFGGSEVPRAVAATFARGGRNLQRTHDDEAERRTEELWTKARSGDAA